MNPMQRLYTIVSTVVALCSLLGMLNLYMDGKYAKRENVIVIQQHVDYIRADIAELKELIRENK